MFAYGASRLHLVSWDRKCVGGCVWQDMCYKDATNLGATEPRLRVHHCLGVAAEHDEFVFNMLGRASEAKPVLLGGTWHMQPNLFNHIVS